MRGVARILGVPDDSRSRATLSRMLRAQSIDTGHFSRKRVSIPEDRLRDSVQHSESYAAFVRGLCRAVNDTTPRRGRGVAARLGLNRSHFKRRTWAQPERPA